jgi:hypothetical protein
MIHPGLVSDSIFDEHHHFHGEKWVVTEDVFCLAMYALIERVRAVEAELRQKKEQRRKEKQGLREAQKQHERRSSGDEKPAAVNRAPPQVPNPASPVLSTEESSSDDEHSGSDEGKNVIFGDEMADDDASFAWGAAQAASSCSSTLAPKTVSVLSSAGFRLEVFLEGDFTNWELEINPRLEDITDAMSRLLSCVLLGVSRLPCLLEHPLLVPFESMAKGRALSLHLTDDSESQATWNQTEDTSQAKSDEEVEVLLARSVWVRQLEGDRYFREVRYPVSVPLVAYYPHYRPLRFRLAQAEQL